jgi:hypothetical protein
MEMIRYISDDVIELTEDGIEFVNLQETQ